MKAEDPLLTCVESKHYQVLIVKIINNIWNTPMYETAEGSLLVILIMFVRDTVPYWIKLIN